MMAIIQPTMSSCIDIWIHHSCNVLKTETSLILAGFTAHEGEWEKPRQLSDIKEIYVRFRFL